MVRLRATQSALCSDSLFFVAPRQPQHPRPSRRPEAGRIAVRLNFSCRNQLDNGATEENAAVTFERQSKEDEVDKATKEKGVEYKTKEAESHDQTVTELPSDRDDV